MIQTTKVAGRLARYLERDDHGDNAFGIKAPEPPAVDNEAINSMFDGVDNDRDGMISRCGLVLVWNFVPYELPIFVLCDRSC